MNRDLYLLWMPGGWGVYGYSCPDTAAFSSYMYRKYTVTEEQYDEIFRKLMEIKERIDSEDVVPTRANERNIFPDISALLSD